MKTILFVDHTAKLGGGEIALLNLVTALDETRYRPIVALAADGPLVGRLRAAGVETHILPLDSALLDTRKDSLGVKSLLRLRQIGQVLAYTVQLARWARGQRVDLIHTNSLKSDIYGGLAGRLAGITVLWHVRDHINGKYLPPMVAAAFRILAWRLPQMVVANSESTLRQIWPNREAASAVVYSGVATQVVHDGYPEEHKGQDEQAGSKSAPDRDWPTVTLVGRIAEWKGQHVFLRAAASVLGQYPQTRFWIVGAPLFGEHDYALSLHTLAEELGITKKVEFLGFRNDVAQILSRTDIVVHASILGEPFGQVVIEGMAAGKPLVATDGGALPEIVVPGETGFLVPMGDHAAMADALRTLLADPERAHEMGEEGRQRVERLFTIGHTARKLEAVYETLFAQGKPMRISSHLSGGKYTASHTTVIEAASAPAQAAAGLACVSKVSLGLIKTLKNGPPAIKFLDESAGCLLAKVRGTRSLQEIRVYTSDKVETQAAMASAFTGR